MKKMFGALAVLVVLAGCGGQEKDNEEGSMNFADSSIIYDCQGEEVYAEFDNTVSPSIVKLSFMDRDDVSIVLENVETGSGAKYMQGDVVFWTHQGEATLSMNDEGSESLTCTEVSDDMSKDAEVMTDENGNTVTPGCETWFDGCNTCQVGEPGMPMACTRKYCAPEMMQSAKCLDDDIKAECEAAGGVWVDELNECMEDPENMAGSGEK